MSGFYALDDLVFEILMRLRLIEASKNIVEHLWTLDNWDSIYALWLDDFGLSDYEPVTLFYREIQQQDQQTVFFGVMDDSDECIPYKFFNAGAAAAASPYP